MKRTVSLTSRRRAAQFLMSWIVRESTDRLSVAVFINAAHRWQSLRPCYACRITSPAHCHQQLECLPNGLSVHCDPSITPTASQRRVFWRAPPAARLTTKHLALCRIFPATSSSNGAPRRPFISVLLFCHYERVTSVIERQFAVFVADKPNTICN